ncbi:MAG TPA: molybdopterin molybdotransferase MoeA [Candidatus Krumholzibacteria bacterium]|nr:molybdopterin molybdotransferase MoeA [Candidatus Krumholzibacteria bacterium]HPD70286.1 molybdopterin molybdotransferase MoeA [Candidatus Krumholzibacteria bacterium]HRY40014.1 molybdopterin molybdotransferase MoeA [Candidatus Krumholzibacteria bacterium]
MGEMITFEQATAIVLGSARYLGDERVPLSACLGRVLAADARADLDLPPFDKSAMDGFACRRADLPGPLVVVATVAAGATPTAALAPRQCARIMTGAPIPRGADCVVKFEDAEVLPDGTVRSGVAARSDNICRQGEDARRGGTVLPRGTRIGPQHVAVLATVGCAQVPVARRPRVAILATGDELVPVDARPAPGQIRNSNGPQLEAQALAAGVLPAVYGPVRDDREDLTRALRQAAAEHDVVLLSGGVSEGDFDLVPQAMQDVGLVIRFDRVAVKPGRPTTFAVGPDVWCFGLPGNPVSTFLQFEFLVKPLLRRLMGCDREPPVVTARLAGPVSRRHADRESWLPVMLTDAGDAQPLEYHGSGHINALWRADGIIAVPAGTKSLAKGALVRVRPLSATH